MILVTGATGNVGRYIVAQLTDAGQPVRALTRDPAKAAKLLPSVEVVAGDLADPASLPAALDGVTSAFLFPVHGELESFLGLAAQAGLDRVVLLSSAAAMAPESGALARVHLECEQAVKDSGLPWTFVRPGAFMVNDLAWARSIRETGAVRAPYPESATTPIDERDIAAVAVTALLEDGHQGQAYWITGPEALSQAERVAQIGQAIGRELRFEEEPAEEYRRRMSGWPAEVLDSLLAMMASHVGERPPVSGAVEEVTGRPARTYRDWLTLHHEDFAGLTQ